MILAQSQKESFLPTFRVNSPTHFGFAFRVQSRRPNRSVTIIRCHIETINNSHPSGQFALCLHIHVVPTPLRSYTRIESNAHRNRIRQTNSIFSGLHFVRVAGVTIAFDGKLAKVAAESLNQFDIGLIYNSFCARELPANQLNGKSAQHDDARSLWVHPDVVFGCWRHISFTARSSSHDHAAADFRGNCRLLGQRESHISERPQGDKDESGVRFDRFDDCVNSVKLFGQTTRHRVIVISKSVTTMKPRGICIRAQQRLLRANIDRNISPAQSNGIERVASGLLHVNIPGHRRDRSHADVGGS